MNSLRICFMRDSSHKGDLPNGFIKMVDDLLTDVIDVSSASNADIVGKCVNILKIMGEFVNTQKKKEEAKALSDKNKHKGEELKQ